VAETVQRIVRHLGLYSIRHR